MLRPRALGRRVAPNTPTLFRHSQTIPGKKKHIKENQSLSSLHVIVICFRLLRWIQAPTQSISTNFRQNQAESGNFRQNQALFRQNQADFRQNQAKSGSPFNLATSLVRRDPMLFQEAQIAPLFWAEFFWVHAIKNKAQANHNQTASNGIILPNTWQLC